MTVFEEHGQRLADEALGSALQNLIRYQKQRAKKLNAQNRERWEKSRRHRLALWLEYMSHHIDPPMPEHIDWRTLPFQED